MVPEGADAVVRVEDTDGLSETGRDPVEVEPGREHPPRRRGHRARATVLGPGASSAPAELGVLASVGAATVACARRPACRVVGTGDELIGAGEPMRPGAVRNSNAYTRAGAGRARRRRGGAHRARRRRPDATREALAPALDADIVVVCGGVSVGEHDHVKARARDARRRAGLLGRRAAAGQADLVRRRAPDGARWSSACPATRSRRCVTFVLFVRPALCALQGARPGALAATRDPRRGLPRAWPSATRRPLPARAARRRLARHPDRAQGSHVLTSMLGADACAIAARVRARRVEAGERVEIELLRRR